MKTVEQYAVDLVAEGAYSFADDDTNEDEEIADDKHEAAVYLALRIACAIKDNPQAVLALVRDTSKTTV